MYHSATFDAIGVVNQVTVTDRALLDDALGLATRDVAELDRAASRFRDDSELSLLNRSGRAVASPLLFTLIEAAVDAARWSDGLVDPTVGRALRALGYDRDFDVVVRRGAQRPIELVPASGWQSVRLDASRSLVELRPGTELDLGATAKALAADRIAAAIHDALGCPVLVSLGGDVAVAGPPPGGGWPIGVGDDSRGAGGETVAIRSGGLATSSTTVRRWLANGIELHHLVQPATGAPAAEIWRTVSVAASSCLAANVAATSAILRGATAPAWLQAKVLPARLVRRDGSVVCSAGWPNHSRLTESKGTVDL